MTSRIEQIVSELEEYVDNCKPYPFSGSKIIANKDELEEYLGELRRKLPQEITKYKNLIEKKDAILSDAREQAASCQKVLGGWANIAKEYATKRYRSNLINWGMLPFVMDEDYDFDVDDYVFIPGVAQAIRNKDEIIKAYVVNKDMKELSLKLGDLTDDERDIILAGCLINYYKTH